MKVPTRIEGLRSRWGRVLVPITFSAIVSGIALCVLLYVAVNWTQSSAQQDLLRCGQIPFLRVERDTKNHLSAVAV